MHKVDLRIETLKGPDGLEVFAKQCEDALLFAKPIPFIFPKEFSKNWLVKEIKEKNKGILSVLNNNANVYAIFIRKRGSKWQIKYVGQRKCEGIRERITQHLIDKDPRTGSVLEKVRKAVFSDKEVGLSFIKVEPDSLRLFVEETIIRNNKSSLEWNTHG